MLLRCLVRAWPKNVDRITAPIERKMMNFTHVLTIHEAVPVAEMFTKCVLAASCTVACLRTRAPAAGMFPVIVRQRSVLKVLQSQVVTAHPQRTSSVQSLFSPNEGAQPRRSTVFWQSARQSLRALLLLLTPLVLRGTHCIQVSCHSPVARRSARCRLPGEPGKTVLASLCRRYIESRSFRGGDDADTDASLYAGVRLFAAAALARSIDEVQAVDFLKHFADAPVMLRMSNVRKAAAALNTSGHAYFGRHALKHLCRQLAAATPRNMAPYVPDQADGGAAAGFIHELDRAGVIFLSPDYGGAEEDRQVHDFVAALATQAAYSAPSCVAMRTVLAAAGSLRVLGYKHVDLIKVQWQTTPDPCCEYCPRASPKAIGLLDVLGHSPILPVATGSQCTTGAMVPMHCAHCRLRSSCQAPGPNCLFVALPVRLHIRAVRPGAHSLSCPADDGAPADVAGSDVNAAHATPGDCSRGARECAHVCLLQRRGDWTRSQAAQRPRSCGEHNAQRPHALRCALDLACAGACFLRRSAFAVFIMRTSAAVRSPLQLL